MQREDDRDDLEHTGYRSGRVRIIGAEPAGRSTARSEDEDVSGWGEQAEPEEQPEEEFGRVVTPPLPHWTEPATGEVPAVLSQGEESAEIDRFASVRGPIWREGHSDWEAHDEDFEPAMLGDEEAGQGLMSGGSSDRQPWVFDLPGSPRSDGGLFEEEAAWEETESDWAELGSLTSASSWQDEEADGPITEVIPVVGQAHGPGGVDTGDIAEQAVGMLAEDSFAYEEDLDERPVPEEPVRAAEPRSLEEPLVIDDVDAVSEAPRSLLRSLRSERQRGEQREAPQRRRLARQGSELPQRPVPARLEPPLAPHPGESAPRNVTAAIFSGLALGALTLVAFKVGPVAAVALVTIVLTMAAAEAFAAFRRGGYHPVTLLGLVATVSLSVATYNRGQAALPLVLVLLVGACFVWHLAGVESTDTVRSIGTTLFVFGWVAVFGSFAALLLALPERHGIAFLLGAIIASVSYDIGALGFGAWLGRHPLSSLSPNKTWEGVVGGLVTSLLLSVVIVHLISPWTVGKAAALALVVSVVSTLGDLFESTVKRHLDRKDMGRLLPGHGGLLDRIDGLLFALPATYYLILAFHLG